MVKCVKFNYNRGKFQFVDIFIQTKIGNFKVLKKIFRKNNFKPNKSLVLFKYRTFLINHTSFSLYFDNIDRSQLSWAESLPVALTIPLCQWPSFTILSLISAEMFNQLKLQYLGWDFQRLLSMTVSSLTPDLPYQKPW